MTDLASFMAQAFFLSLRLNFQIKLTYLFADMRIAGSCRQSLSVPAVLWTSVILLSLASGVCYASEEPIRNERSTSAEIQGYPSPDVSFI